MRQIKKGFLNRTLALLMALLMVLAGVPQTMGLNLTAEAAVTESSAAQANGLTEKVKDGVILHCWCWSFDTIRENMADIAAAGYSSIQTSPANKCNDRYPTRKLMGNDTKNGTDGCWWWQYQPTDWTIGNYQLGTEEDFAAMCKEADKYGIKVLVDVLPNHTTPDYDKIDQNLVNAVGGWDALYHANGKNEIEGDEWKDRKESTTGMMGGLPDVNTENPKFQEYYLKFVNKLIGYGVDGFRYDTAKHIGVPSDPLDAKSSRNNFWPVAVGKESVNGVTLANKDEMFIYGEVLQSANENIPYSEYAQYIETTASDYGHTLRNCVQGKNFNVNSISNWGHAYPTRMVTWVESHDNYCNDGSYNINNSYIIQAWAVAAARNQGTPLFFSRPNGSSTNNMWGNNVLGAIGDSTFKDPQVTAVNFFRNAMMGQPEYLRNPNGNSQILQIDRGTEGTCIINLGGGTSISNKTTMSDGSYVDQVSGRTFTVSGGVISGKLDGGKVAVIYNTDDEKLLASSATGSPNFSTSTLDVELTVKNVTEAAYETSEGDKGSFDDGTVITIGKKTSEGGTVTVTLTGKGKNGPLKKVFTFTKVGKNVAYIQLPSGWSAPYCYAYSKSNESITNGVWPGAAMTEVRDGIYKYEIPDTISDPLVIFYGGSNSNRYPADMQPGLELTGSMIYKDSEWILYKDQNPDITDIISSLESGNTFDTESETITLTLKNAKSGTYSVDDGPVKTFTDSADVVIGKGKIADTDVTVKTTAINGDQTVEKTFTYHKKFNASKNGGVTEVETAAAAVQSAQNFSSESLGGNYATNPNDQMGAYKTIRSASDFTDSMIIAQGVANDDPRIFRGSHEGPVYDSYALYGAWDDENVYVGWQFTNVTDVVDPAQSYPISDNGKPNNGDIPQILAFNLNTGNITDGSLDTGGYVWGIDIGYETAIDAMACFSSKAGLGQPALFQSSADGTFSYDTCVGFDEAGITYKAEDGFFGSSVIGINGNGYSGYVPSMVLDANSNWINFLDAGHSKTQDTFYTMTIPMDSLGITKDDIQNYGIGVMHISTFGQSGIASLPMDMTMLDNATEEYSADNSTSHEKEDVDTITVPLARLGAADSGQIIDPKDMTVNFGADRSSPQVDTTDLTLKAIASGGSGSYTYQFLVDGKEIQNNEKDTCVWDTVGGAHSIEVVVTDSESRSVSCSKEYEIEGEIPVNPIEIQSLKADKTAGQPVGTSVTFTAQASGGTGSLKYRFLQEYKGKSEVIQEFSSKNKVTFAPSQAGAYKITVEVQDENGEVVSKGITYEWTENKSDLKVTSFTASKKSPQPKGTSILLTAKAEGGEGDLKYCFYRIKNGKKTIFRDYSQKNTAYCNPGEGSYVLYVEVQDETGNVAQASMDYTWVSAAVEITEIGVNKASPQPKGTTVKLTASTKGGSGQFQYRFYREKDEKVTIFRDYDQSNIAYCNPASGTYKIYVEVKDVNTGDIATSFITYTWSASETPLIMKSFTANKESPQKQGTSVRLEAKAEGGSGELQYRFYRVGNGKTKVLRDFAASNVAYCNPPSGDYLIYVDVKDSNGEIVTKKMLYQWN